MKNRDFTLDELKIIAQANEDFEKIIVQASKDFEKIIEQANEDFEDVWILLSNQKRIQIQQKSL